MNNLEILSGIKIVSNIIVWVIAIILVISLLIINKDNRR